MKLFPLVGTSGRATPRRHARSMGGAGTTLSEGGGVRVAPPPLRHYSKPGSCLNQSWHICLTWTVNRIRAGFICLTLIVFAVSAHVQSYRRAVVGARGLSRPFPAFWGITGAGFALPEPRARCLVLGPNL